MKPAPWIVPGVVMATVMLLMVAAACDDGSGERTGSLPSPDASRPAPANTNTPPPTSTDNPAPASTKTPVPADTTTPQPPDRPAVNIQFIGGDDLSGESKLSLADLIERIQAGVVQITTASGSGSGFIVDEGGLVVTNAHVVAGERSASVWLTNGRFYQGDVLERDETADLALVQIDGSGPFDAIAIGNPDGVRVGDEVLALGFPLADRIGTNLTVTRGIISSTRTVAGVALLQTDAAVNPGNSGGPLVNIDGEVIGVNTSRVEETDSGRPVSNIGFAVSVSELERRLPALGGRQLAGLGTPTPAPALAPTPEPTWTPEPTFTPAPTWTPTSIPTPTRTPKSLLPEILMTPIPALPTVIIPAPTPYIPEGLDVHGYEQFVFSFETLGFVFEVSTKDGLKQVSGTKNGMTLTFLGPNDALHSIKLSWDNETPIAELEVLTIHADPRGTTWCIIDVFNEPPASLVIRGDYMYATATIENDGRTSLTYTSWEHMPAFLPNNLPSTC